jgi:hypothetical protein
MMESIEALARYDKDAVKPYVAVFESSLAYAYKNYKNENGFLPHDYLSGYIKSGGTANDRQLLTQCGTAEIAVLLALVEEIA